MAAITEKPEGPIIRGVTCLRKVKYFQIQSALHEEFDEKQVNSIMTTIRNVMNFDPAINTYNEGVKRSIYKQREKNKAKLVQALPLEPIRAVQQPTN